MNKTKPNHIAIILDGNGRWATKNKLEKIEGHLAGVEAVRNVINYSLNHEIKFLSLFALSSENIKRPREEVEYLMQIYMDVLGSDSDPLHEQGVALKFIGDRTFFSKELQESMNAVEKKTSENNKLTLIAALNYGGKWDIMQAVTKVAHDHKAGKIDVTAITQEVFDSYLSTSWVPEPDLCIRPGGVFRISNFYLWQLSYSEFYFTDVLWPDFGEVEFNKALDSFAVRNRRYGLRNEQIK